MIHSDRVKEIFEYCLFKDNEIIDGTPIVEPIYTEGIHADFGLHPERIKESTKEIEGFINELPETFREGWSFLNICMNKDQKEMWTSLHQRCEQLVVLGIAIDKMEYCVPRNMWDVLPGSVPYIRVL